MSQLMNIPHLVADPRWRERNAGDWQGVEVSTLTGIEYDTWRQNTMADIPGGETFFDFQNRLTAALKDSLTWAQHWGPLIVVAHDGVQQVICRNLKLPYPYSPLCGPSIHSPRGEESLECAR